MADTGRTPEEARLAALERAIELLQREVRSLTDQVRQAQQAQASLFGK